MDISIEVAEKERSGRVDFGSLWVSEVYWSRALVGDGVATTWRGRGGEVWLADLAQVGN
jgi:hypothetical protein